MTLLDNQTIKESLRTSLSRDVKSTVEDSEQEDELST
jgi:hypothetical protein